jgi:AcrR family transcriptional regulator
MTADRARRVRDLFEAAVDHDPATVAAWLAREAQDDSAVRADVFALGVLLYEYACGVHPFAASTPLGTIARVLESDARPLVSRVDVPERFAEAIARCLQKAPSEAGHRCRSLWRRS